MGEEFPWPRFPLAFGSETPFAEPPLLGEIPTSAMTPSGPDLPSLGFKPSLPDWENPGLLPDVGVPPDLV